MEGKKIIALFDVDLTLTPARNPIQQKMLDTLYKVQEKGVAIGTVSGSDLAKITDQLTPDFIKRSDYTFPENGLVAIRKGERFAQKSIKDEFGEEKLKKIINFCLRYIADLDIPIKR